MTLDHIGLSVEDLDAQVEWYGQTLGMRMVDAFRVEQLNIRGAFMISEDGLVLELLERTGSSAGMQADSPAEALMTRGYGHICLRVSNVDAAHAKLLAAGGRERLAPQPSPEAGVNMSFIADPEGNLIELIDSQGPRRA